MAGQSSEAKFRVRPFRFSCLERPDDLQSVGAAIQVGTALWDGGCNSIIPVFQNRASRYCEEGWPGPNARSFLEEMIDAFDPDFFVPMTHDLATVASSVVGQRVVTGEQIFPAGEDDDAIRFGVSVSELFAHLYERRFQFVERHPLKVLTPKAADASFARLIACSFGEFPTTQRLAILGEAYQEEAQSIISDALAAVPERGQGRVA